MRDFLQITLCCGIACIDLLTFLQLSSGLLPFLCVHVKQRQKLVCPDILRIIGKHLLKLDHSQILTVLPAVRKCLIVLLDRLVDAIESRLIILDHVNIIIGDIFLRAEILADDPLTKGGYSFSHFKINKSQKISRINIVLVQFNTFFQTGDRS